MKCRHDAGMAFRDLCDDCREAVGRPRNSAPPSLADAARAAERQWAALTDLRMYCSQNGKIATGLDTRLRQFGHSVDALRAALAAHEEREAAVGGAIRELWLVGKAISRAITVRDEEGLDDDHERFDAALARLREL